MCGSCASYLIQWNVRFGSLFPEKTCGLHASFLTSFHPGSWKNFARTLGGWSDESLTHPCHGTICPGGWNEGVAALQSLIGIPKTDLEPKSIVPQKSLDSKNSFVQVFFVLFGKIWLNLQIWEPRTSEHRDVFCFKDKDFRGCLSEVAEMGNGEAPKEPPQKKTEPMFIREHVLFQRVPGVSKWPGLNFCTQQPIPIRPFQLLDSFWYRLGVGRNFPRICKKPALGCLQSSGPWGKSLSKKGAWCQDAPLLRGKGQLWLRVAQMIVVEQPHGFDV